MSLQGRNRPLGAVDIEDHIAALCDELERATERYADVSSSAAVAEADYRYESARLMLAVIALPDRMTAQERTARVDVAVHDKRQAYLINDAARHSAREALLSLRTRLEALRTLSASVRVQT